MPVEIVAEIGCNHQNDLNIANQLIWAAKDAGATVVKFQASTVDEEVSQRYDPEQYALLKRIVPDAIFLRDCAQICERAGVEFLCTPAGPESLATVLQLGVKRIKVASDNLNNPPFLRLVAATGLPIILSTGMATLGDIAEATSRLARADVPVSRMVTLLHCTTAYPCPPEDANLKAITTMQACGWCPIGFSDHTLSVTLPAAAAALGAVMIEKHMTLDRSMPGPDHAASLMPLEFDTMVRRVREVEEAMGDGLKRMMPIERQEHRYRKGLVAARFIAEGDILRECDIEAKRPGFGLSVSKWGSIVGTQATRDYEAGEFIE